MREALVPLHISFCAAIWEGEGEREGEGEAEGEGEEEEVQRRSRETGRNQTGGFELAL